MFILHLLRPSTLFHSSCCLCLSLFKLITCYLHLCNTAHVVSFAHLSCLISLLPSLLKAFPPFPCHDFSNQFCHLIEEQLQVGISVLEMPRLLFSCYAAFVLIPSYQCWIRINAMLLICRKLLAFRVILYIESINSPCLFPFLACLFSRLPTPLHPVPNSSLIFSPQDIFTPDAPVICFK